MTMPPNQILQRLERSGETLKGILLQRLKQKAASRVCVAEHESHRNQRERPGRVREIPIRNRESLSLGRCVVHAMRFASGILLSLLVVSCAHTQNASSHYAPIAKHLTPELINRHLRGDTTPSSQLDSHLEDNRWIVDFGRCLITIGRGSSFFTETDYKERRNGFFATMLGEELFPKIGRRAYIGGIEQDIALFTTSDGRFDVRIEPRGTPQPVDVVGIAKELSELYDIRSDQIR